MWAGQEEEETNVGVPQAYVAVSTGTVAPAVTTAVTVANRVLVIQVAAVVARFLIL